MRRLLYKLPVLLLFFVNLIIQAQFGQNQELFTGKFYASFDKVYTGEDFQFALKGTVKQTWHINSNKPNEDFLIATQVRMINEDGFTVSNIVYPAAKNVEFGFSDKPVSVYEGELLVYGDVTVPANIELGTYQLFFEMIYQACNDMSCMAPVTIKDTLTVEVVSKQTPVNQINGEIFSDMQVTTVEASENNDSLAATLESSGIIVALLIVFLGGLALNLTPCVYPLIPITVGYFGGQSEGNTGRLFYLGLLYVLGMALTYSVVGVVTSLSGAVFGSLLQNTYVTIGIAGVLVALALSMFGLYEFKMPDKWVMKAGGARAGGFGAFFMGLTMGIVAAPCIGPFVLGLVTYVAAKGDPFYGFLMFFFLALGLGTPYLFLALFSGKIKNLPKAGFWMNAVKHIFGFILIGMAIYFLLPVLPEPIDFYALPVFMILASLYLIFFDKLANNIRGFRIFKSAFALIIIVFAGYSLWPAEKLSPDWKEFSESAFDLSLDKNEKIIIDFYADWCIPCKELDALTFSDERIIEITKEFANYKVDMTQTLSDKTEHLRNRFNIIGMPTILIIDSQGNEVERLTGFVTADEFLKLINKTK